jgi:hypothetical protein
MYPMIEDDVRELLDQAKRHYGTVEKEVKALLDTLTPRENACIRHLFGLGREQLNHKTTAKRFAITTERLGQIEHRALRKITAKPRVNELEGLWRAVLHACKTSSEMNYGDTVNDFLCEVRERGGFANDKDFDLIVGQVFYDKLTAAIDEEREACARLVELPTFIGLDDLAKAIRARKSKGD